MEHTKLAQMIDPEVMADMISANLKKEIRFLPLAEVDTTLVGQPGSRLVFPKWEYIGDATELAEGEALELSQMKTTQQDVEVKKAAQGVSLTDEAVNSGLGDPIGEAVRQLQLAIAHKVDNDLLEAAGQTKLSVADAPTTVNALQKAIDVFSHEDDEPMTLVVNPVDAGKLRADAQKNYLFGSEVGAESVVKGALGEVLGVQIVRSNKVNEGEGLLIKRGALKLVMKQDVQVERDRDIIAFATVVTASEHYAPYLYDESRVVKLGQVGG